MKIEKMDVMPENTPPSIAAGVVYFIAQLCKLNISKKDVKNVSDILTKPPFDSFVKRSGVDEIELKTDQSDSTPSKDQQEKSEDRIDKIAKKVAKKDVKSGEV